MNGAVATCLKYGGAFTFGTAIITALWFWYAHFAQAQTTTARSISTEKIVNELQAIKIKQATAAEARIAQVKELCLAGKLKDREECAKAGVRPIQ